MDKIKFVFCIIWVLLYSEISGQSKQSFLSEAEKAFTEKNYHGALVYYDEAWQFDKTDASVLFKTAESARLYNAYGYAASKYHYLLDTLKNNDHSDAIFRLAEMYHKLGSYDDALRYYNQYLSEYSNADEILTGEARKNISSVTLAKTLVQSPDPNYKVELLGEDINTVDADFAGSERAGTMYFSSLRFESKSKNLRYKQIAKTLFRKTGSQVGLISTSPMFQDKSVANFAFNEAGNKVFFSVCDYINGWSQSCEIYVANIDENGILTNEAKLSETINQTGTSNTHPYPGKDLSTGKDGLYFVSNRKGGSGGKDIWFSSLENDTYGVATPVSEINTEKDEITPFYHAASSTLYFSTDGRPGYGGLDVFSISNNTINLLPTPVNTSMNDMYYYINPEEDKGFLTSNRSGFYNQYTSYEACCMDIYSVSINNKIELDVLTFLQPDGTDLTGTTICLYDEDAGRLIECLTNTEFENKKSFILSPNKNYKITATKDGYISAMDKFRTNSTERKLIKKLYLAKDVIKLEVFTFDKNTQKELIGTTVTLTDLTDGSVKEIVITNDTSNDFKFDIDKGREYKVSASKSGYSSAMEIFNTNNVTGVLRKNLFLAPLLPLSLYFDNDYPNPRTKLSKTKSLYTDLSKQYLTKQKEYIENYTMPLSGKEKEMAADVLNNFFINEVGKSNDKLIEVLNFIQNSLEKGQKVELEVRGFASPRAKTLYNKILSKRRISSVMNDMFAFNNGILKKYYKNKLLIVKDISFGEEASKSGISDDIKDQRNSIYFIGAALERRVEIVNIIFK